MASSSSSSIFPPSSGVTLSFEVLGELSFQDLLNLNLFQMPQSERGVPPITRLRHRHQLAARLIAIGRPDFEISHETGYSVDRLKELRTNDPSFKELVSYFSAQVDQKILVDGSRLAAKSLEAAEIATDLMLDKLETEAAKPVEERQISMGELRQIAAHGLDRTVLPAKTAQPQVIVPTQITFNMGNKDIRPKEPEAAAQPALPAPVTIDHED